MRLLAPLLAAVALPLLVSACAGALTSRSWEVPRDDPEARACYEECTEIRKLCTSRPTRDDVAGVQLPPNASIMSDWDGEDDARSRRCSEDFDRCVGACPGAVRRQ